ncbi:MAG: proton-conducting transporter membrane subunit, partial [Gemmatimonadota bacterium]
MSGLLYNPAVLALGALALATLGAVAGALAGKGGPRGGRLVAGCLAAAWAVAALAAARVAIGGAGAFGAAPWLEGDGWGLRLGLRVDTLGSAALLAVLTAGLAAQLYATSRAHAPLGASAPFLMAAATAALSLAVTADSAALCLAGWAGAAAATCPLLAASVPTVGNVRLVGATHWLAAAIILSAAVLALAGGSQGPGAVPAWLGGVGLAGAEATVWTVGLVAAAAAIQAGVLPFHVWLQAAGGAPPPMAALLLGATAATGAYAFGRLAALLPLSPGLAPVVAATGLAAVALAAGAGLATRRLTVGLACAASAQAGLTACLASVAGEAATAAYLVAAGAARTGLVLAAGLALRAVTTGDDLRRMGGLRAHLPLAWRSFLVCALTVGGLPPFAGFWAGVALLEAAGAAGPLPMALAWAVLTLVAAVPLRLGFAVFAGPRRATALAAAAGQPAGWPASWATVGVVAAAVLAPLFLAGLQGGGPASLVRQAMAGGGVAAG